jgi:hypothetical protein
LQEVVVNRGRYVDQGDADQQHCQEEMHIAGDIRLAL